MAIDLANDWQLIVPRKINIMKDTIDDKGNNIIKVTSNIVHSKINLAQLPRHLWCKRKNLRNGNIRITEKSHYYYVDKTNVDDEIITLERILSNPYDISYREKVNELLEVIKDNNINGWVTLKASRLYE